MLGWFHIVYFGHTSNVVAHRTLVHYNPIEWNCYQRKTSVGFPNVARIQTKMDRLRFQMEICSLIPHDLCAISVLKTSSVISRTCSY